MNSPSRFDGEVSKPYFPHFSSECGHSKPTNPQQETTTKPRPSREVDGAEIFHNPKKNPIISPVLVPYPVLNPGDKGKSKPVSLSWWSSRWPQPPWKCLGICQGWINSPLLDLHFNGWNIAQILITWQRKTLQEAALWSWNIPREILPWQGSLMASPWKRSDVCWEWRSALLPFSALASRELICQFSWYLGPLEHTQFVSDILILVNGSSRKISILGWVFSCDPIFCSDSINIFNGNNGGFLFVSSHAGKVELFVP